MQGLSAFRVAHCWTSLGGSSPTPSPAPRQRLLLLGFQHRSSFFQRGAPAIRRLRASPQEEPFTKDTLPPLVENEGPTKLAEEHVSTNDGAFEKGPKVNVKFILEKKCYFGQRFNVVGSIHRFGNWDVKAAVPMEWTEGDIWTAEADVPAEKEVEFKFVLTGEHGEIEWQPGPNRVFSTVEGISSLVVNEAWKPVKDDVTKEAVGKPSALAEDTTSSDTDGLLVPADVMKDEAVGKPSSPAEGTTSLDTDGLLVPADVTKGVAEDEVKAAEDEVVKALESKSGEDAPKPEPQTVPEIPLAELDVAATAVKAAVGVDD